LLRVIAAASTRFDLNAGRHLCEFTGLDFEMPIVAHYGEAIAVGHATFKRIFDGLERDHADLLAAVRAQFPSEAPVVGDAPLVLSFAEAREVLRAAGRDPGAADDLSGADELALGAAVKATHGVDFFVVDRYPSAVRPFYTMPCADDPAASNSYDFFLRGQEICTGLARESTREGVRSPGAPWVADLRVPWVSELRVPWVAELRVPWVAELRVPWVSDLRAPGAADDPRWRRGVDETRP